LRRAPVSTHTNPHPARRRRSGPPQAPSRPPPPPPTCPPALSSLPGPFSGPPAPLSGPARLWAHLLGKGTILVHADGEDVTEAVESAISKLGRYCMRPLSLTKPTTRSEPHVGGFEDRHLSQGDPWPAAAAGHTRSSGKPGGAQIREERGGSESLQLPTCMYQASQLQAPDRRGRAFSSLIAAVLRAAGLAGVVKTVGCTTLDNVTYYLSPHLFMDAVVDHCSDVQLFLGVGSGWASCQPRCGQT